MHYEKLIELRKARTAWHEKNGVPISDEYARFLRAVGEIEDSFYEPQIDPRLSIAISALKNVKQLSMDSVMRKLADDALGDIIFIRVSGAAQEEAPSPATYAQREKLTTVDSRESYIRAKLSTLVPSQIRAVRLKRGLSQKQLADLCGMKQARISEMETAGACNYTIATLARIAAAVGIALQIEFCTFAEMLDWENSYSQDSFDVTPITSGVVAEEEAGAPHE